MAWEGITQQPVALWLRINIGWLLLDLQFLKPKLKSWQWLKPIDSPNEIGPILAFFRYDLGPISGPTRQETYANTGVMT